MANEKIEKFDSRNSSLELLKIISIILIIFSHSVPFYGIGNEVWYIDGNITTIDIQLLIIKFIRIFGQIGNVIFIACSSYFLIDSHKIKANKILNIMINSWIISVIYLIICFLLKYEVSVMETIKQLFPIIFKNNWFIGCYLLLYLFHPFLNIIIQTVSKQTLFYINLFFVMIYGIIYFVLHNDIYYTELLGFIIIYFLVAFSKKYMHEFNQNIKLNKIIIIVTVFLHIFSILFTNYIGLFITQLANKVEHWNSLVNPLYIIFSICIINICNNKKIINKKINYISSLSIFVYLISENCLFKSKFYPKLFEYIYNNFNYNYKLLIIFIVGLISVIVFYAISMIYKETIAKKIKLFSTKIEQNMTYIFKNINKEIDKIK